MFGKWVSFFLEGHSAHSQVQDSVNRTIILQVRVDVKEWVQWAIENHIREDIISFILLVPEALQRPVPNLPVPFSTPRAWASLSQAMELLEKNGSLTESTTRAVVFGSVSAEDAAVFMEMQKIALSDQQNALKDADDYIFDPDLLPENSEGKPNPLRCVVLKKIRTRILEIKDDPQSWKRYHDITPEICNRFLQRLRDEEKVSVMLNCVSVWGKLGADETLLRLFSALTGIEIKA